jgi:diguanylate cyclase (GGDEF)-like protein
MNEKMTIKDFMAAYNQKAATSPTAGFAYAKEIFENPNIKEPQTHQAACYIYAVSLFYEAKFEEAEKLLKSYIFSYQHYHFNILYIDTFDLLGIIQLQKKRYHLAIFYEQQAISLALDKKIPGRLASLYNNLAGSYHSIKDFTKCLEYLDAGLAHLKEADEASMGARLVLNRAQTLFSLGRGEEALEALTKAEGLIKEHPLSPVETDEIPLLRGEIKLSLHQETDLHQIAQDFLVAPSQKDPTTYVFLLSDDEDLCDLLIKNGLMEDAEVYLKRIEEIEKETPSLLTEVYLAKTKALLAEKKGDSVEAQKQYSLLAHLREQEVAGLDRDFEEITKLYINFVHVANAYLKVKKRARKLLVESDTDALTCLPNRRALEKEKKYFPSFSRKSPYFVLALLDYDHFKQINDGYGYQSGDSALHLGGLLFKSFEGPLTKVFRYGGDEFMFALGVKSPEEAAAFFAKIKKGLEAVELHSPEGEKIDLSCCIGYGLFKGSYTSFSPALRAVTEAIHAAKHIGRGNIVSVAI